MCTLLGAAVAGGLLGVAALTGCGSSAGSAGIGGSVPPVSVPPVSVAPGSTAPSPSVPPVSGGPTGFRSSVIQITRVDGRVETSCVWLATTEAERQRGLMEVTSLGGADGMLFRFDGETATEFWMKDTVLPLSIAFFDSDGAFVSATDMAPCAAGTSSCPRYPAKDRYTDALEVARGALARLGVGERAGLTVTKAGCRPGA